MVDLNKILYYHFCINIYRDFCYSMHITFPSVCKKLMRQIFGWFEPTSHSPNFSNFQKMPLEHFS